VRLLDIHRYGGRDDDVDIRESFHRSSAIACVAHGVDAHVTGKLEGLDTVLRVSAGGDREQHITFETERLDLPLEHIVVAVIIPDRGKDAAIGREGDRAEGGAVYGQTGDEFGDEMLRVGGGASVAADHQFAAGLHGLGGQLASLEDGFMDGLVVEHGSDRGDGLCELFPDEVFDDGLQSELPGYLAAAARTPVGASDFGSAGGYSKLMRWSSTA
jgi:hypothetical protein